MLLQTILLLTMGLSDSFNENFRPIDAIKLDQTTQVIGSVRDAVITHDRVLVCDSLEKNVKIFDMAGRLQAVLGRPGNGPGEFTAPIGVTTDDTIIYVADIKRKSILLFDAKTFAYLTQYRSHDTREIKVHNQQLVSAAPYLEKNQSLHLMDKRTGDITGAFMPLPKITVRNKMICSGISFDMDSAGNYYVLHEMDHQIHKFDRDGKPLKTFDIGNIHYIPPSEKPLKLNYSKKKIMNFITSWTHTLKVTVVHDPEVILANMINYQDEQMILDVFNYDGQKLKAGMTTDMRLLGIDAAGRVCFLEELEGEDAFIIQRFSLKVVQI